MGVQRITNGLAQQEKLLKANRNKKFQFGLCPYCGRKGYYEIPQLYEYCRYCGISRVLLPGQGY